MARLGSAPAADRFGSVQLGPRNNIDYEIQPNLPVDGTNGEARTYSPFRIRFVLPPALAGLEFLKRPQGPLSQAITTNPDTGAEESIPIRDPNIISAASSNYGTLASAKQAKQGVSVGLIGNNRDQVVKVLGSRTADLETFIANGRVRTARDTGAYIEPALADRLQAADIALQALRILEMPPLTLLINPHTMTVSLAQLQSYSERTRGRYVYQGWGEQQVRLSFSGTIGAFFAAANPGFLAPGNLTSETVSGVQFASKRDSASFQNLTNMFQMFRNNGYIYDTLGNSFAMLHVGALAIEYDQWVYIGHMESFGYGYDESKQNGGLEFSIEFTASTIIDTHESLGVVLPMLSPIGASVRRGGPESAQVDVQQPGESALQPEETLGSGISEPQGILRENFGSSSTEIDEPGTQGFRT